MKFYLTAAAFILLYATELFARGCGTATLIEHHNAASTSKAAARTYSSLSNCAAEAYYDTAAVSEKITAHFRIYYVLNGPHATTEAFVDTAAEYLEKAWTFHTQTLGMLAPHGMDTSYQYRKADNSGLYAVEIADIDLIRDAESLFGGTCGGCYGVTIPDNSGKVSELILDNDFKYSSGTLDSLTYNGTTCRYLTADDSIINESNGHYYTQYPSEAIAVTAFHELYHAAQLRYVSFLDYPSYWFEASAAGVEEAGAPTVNDYWSYVPSFFTSTGTAFGSLSATATYGLGVWYQYNYKTQGAKFDASLWKRYSSIPDSSLEAIFAKQLESENISADSVFQNFAQRIFFSGSRSKYLKSSALFASDQPSWPEMRLRNVPASAIQISSTPAFNYYKLKTSTTPDLSSFKGKASIALWNASEDSSVRFYALGNGTSLANFSDSIAAADSAILIVSRLLTSDTSTVIIKDSLPMRAYPDPWKGATPLCFASLPESKSFIEIWTRAGMLAFREKYNGTHLCISEDKVREKLAPGLFYFRAGSHGKTKPFLLIY